MKFKIIFFLFFLIHMSSYAIINSNNLNNNKSELNIGFFYSLKIGDPQKCQIIICSLINRQIFEGLVTLNGAGKIVPGAAEKWNLSSDGKTYTFYLRKNMKWSDGSDLTAHDFVYSIQRIFSANIFHRNTYLSEFIENGKEILLGKKPISSLGVKAINNDILEIYLTKPTPILLESLSEPVTFPVQKKNVEKYGDKFILPQNIVSNGSYVLKKFKNGKKVTLIKNKHYWNESKNIINKVNFYYFSDFHKLYKLYINGKIDIISDAKIEGFKEVINIHSSEITKVPILGGYFYYINTSLAPLNNKKLRQALSIAIDREELNRTVYKNLQIPLYHFLPYGLKNDFPAYPYWYHWTREKQIEEAKKLYLEAGFSKESPLKIKVSYYKSELDKNVANYISNCWRNILGVQTEFEFKNWFKIIENPKTENFQVIKIETVANINDIYDFFNNHTSSNKLNISNYENPKYDYVVSEIMNEIDPVKRKELNHQASLILMEDLPIIPIFSLVNHYLVKPYVYDFKVNRIESFLVSEIKLKNN